MNIFKMFYEWYVFLKFKKTIKNLSISSQNWKNYNFEMGWLGQFGAIVKLRKEDVQDRLGVINDNDMFVKVSIIRHIEPFKEELDSLGLSTVVRPIINRYFAPDKTDVFYQITFWYIFEYTNFKNIFLLLIYIVGIYLILNNLQYILNFLSNLF